MILDINSESHLLSFFKNQEELSKLLFRRNNSISLLVIHNRP